MLYFVSFSLYRSEGPEGKHVMTSLLLLASLAVINAPTHTSAASLGGLHPPKSYFYEDAGDYFSNAEEAEAPSAAKRAPWAPTEIRYDAFVQRLLAGKNKLSGSRDKHSMGGRTDQSFLRTGRSSLDGSDAVSSNDQQLDEISKIVKDLGRQVDEIQVALKNIKSSNEQRGVEIYAAKEENPIERSQVKTEATEGDSKNLEDLMREANEIIKELSSRHVRHRRAVKDSLNGQLHTQPDLSEAETRDVFLSSQGSIKGHTAANTSSAESDALLGDIQADSGERPYAEYLRVETTQPEVNGGQHERGVYLYPQWAQQASDVGRLGGRSAADKRLMSEALQRQGVFVDDQRVHRDSANRQKAALN